MDLEQKLIRETESLVPRPDIALAVVSLAHSSECNIKELSAKVEQDPSLTANMLKLANSAYFGHMKKINSITDIIVRLGVDNVKMLAITGAAVGFLKTPQEAYNFEPGALWQHSYATAILSSIIAKYAKSDNVSSVYSAALLHDIGKIVLNRPLQLECNQKDIFWDGNNIVDFENRLLDTNHITIGVALLKKWGLSDSITRMVSLHHDSKVLSSEDGDCKAVYLANSLAKSIGITSVDTEECLGNMKSHDSEAELAAIPGLNENIEGIIEEFFDKFNN